MAEKLTHSKDWLPAGFTLHQLLATWEDAPIADFDAAVKKIESTDTESDAERFNGWIDNQRVCAMICKHHGNEGLVDIIKAVAKCSIKLDVRMSSRVQSIADFYGME